MNRKALIILLAAAAVVVALVVLAPPPAVQDGDGQGPTKVRADVYASPSCGCCHVYIDYLRSNGFEVRVIEVSDLAPIRAQYGVPEAMASCHTTVVEGYFVEGHVPVQAIQKLLADRPNVRGIALPGMPAGSPGMGGDKAGPFVIYAIADAGIAEFMRL